MNHQFVTDIADVFLLNPLRELFNDSGTWIVALIVAIALIRRKLFPQNNEKDALGDPAWNKFFEERGFAPKHLKFYSDPSILSPSDDLPVTAIQQWCAAENGIEWLIDERGQNPLVRTLTIWLSAEVEIDPDLTAQKFDAIDMVAWAMGRYRRVALLPQQTGMPRPSYSRDASRLLPVLGKVAPLEWPHGSVQVLLEKRRLTAGFAVGRYAVDDAMFATAARDFGRILMPFGVVRIVKVPFPEGFQVQDARTGDSPRPKPPTGIGSMLAALAAAIAASMFALKVFSGPNTVFLTPIIGVLTYTIVMRFLR